MAEVVKADLSQAGRVPGSFDAAAQRGPVNPPSEAVAEDEVVRLGEISAFAQAGERDSRLIRDRDLAGAT